MLNRFLNVGDDQAKDRNDAGNAGESSSFEFHDIFPNLKD